MSFQRMSARTGFSKMASSVLRCLPDTQQYQYFDTDVPCASYCRSDAVQLATTVSREETDSSAGMLTRKRRPRFRQSARAEP